MAQHLRALADLAKRLGLVSKPMHKLIKFCSSASSASDALFWPLGTRNTCDDHTYRTVKH